MNASRPSFQWRALTSVLISACFLLLLLSGIMLFVCPPGRIANWTDWTLLGLTKDEWSAAHIWFASLFVIGATVHLVFNWRPFVTYFKNRLTRHLGFRWEWLIAAGIAAGVFAGTLAGITPFSSLMALNEQLKNSWDEPADRAPIPHAELLTLAELADKTQVNLIEAEARIRLAGWSNFTSNTVIADIAEANHTSAQRVYEVMGGRAGSKSHAGRRGGGLGRKTLAQLCFEQGIPVTDALSRLKTQGIQATEQDTIREIATHNGYERPGELLDVIDGKTP